MTDRVGYLEGWFVAHEARRRGTGRALVRAAEHWARYQNCSEFASDAHPDNEQSALAHRALGFEDVGMVQCFRKDLLAEDEAASYVSSGGKDRMKQAILHAAVVVRDYDEAIGFFCGKLHFALIEDSYQPEEDKRWVVVAPPGSTGTSILLARASTPEQEAFIGRQTGGRVFLFLGTDDFWRDFRQMKSVGIKFVREPKEAPYGTVAVFEDLYGNLWDLVELKNP